MPRQSSFVPEEPQLPDRFNLARIQEAQREAEQLRDQSLPVAPGRNQFQRIPVPQYNPNPGFFQRFATGLSAAQQATQGLQNNPYAGLANALTSGLAAYGVQEPARLKTAENTAEAQNKAALAEQNVLENAPLESVAPGIAAKYGLKNVTLGQFKMIAPFIARTEDTEKQLMLIRERAKLTGSRGQLSPQAAKLLSEITGLPESDLVGLSGIEAQRLGLTPKPLAGETLKVFENISQGAGDLQKAIELFDNTDQKTRKLAAVGLGGGVLRIGNDDAQELNRLIQNASDVLTRQRTGAALNETEVKYYGGLLNDWKRSDGQNRKALVDFLEFYQKVQNEIESGQRGPGTKLLKQGRGKAKTAEQRYNELSKSGKSDDEIYKTLASEGF